MYTGVVDRVARADDDLLLYRLKQLEEQRRALEAETALIVAELDERKVYRHDRHATMWGLLRATLGWSDGECRRRMRIGRLVAAFPDAGEVLYDARASVANIAEIARGYANPRCGGEIEFELGTLLGSACRNEHDVVRRDVVRWEQLADGAATHDAARRAHERRNAHFVNSGESGEFAAQWGVVDGLTNREVFDQFVHAEWEADWELTVAEYGDAASPILMPRTDAQRRADAASKIFQQAASAPPGSKTPKLVTVIHIDHHTAMDTLTEMELLPERFVGRFEQRTPIVTERRCETGDGDPIDPRSAIEVALQGHVRFAVANLQGIPIAWGRQRRLFSGSAREAVMSLSSRCTHPGCRVRAGRSQADHTVEYSRGGLTDPGNGGPQCRRHNNAKNKGFTVWRDPNGTWHTYRPNGTEIP